MTLKMERQPLNKVWNYIPGTTHGVGRHSVEPRHGARGALGLRLLTSVFEKIFHQGSVTLLDPDGIQSRFGHGSPTVTVRIVDWATVYRLLRDPDMALGEAYMDGRLLVEDGSIHDFLDLCMRNTGWGHAMGTGIGTPLPSCAARGAC